MGDNFRSGEQRKRGKRDSHSGREKPNFLAGMLQKHHAVFNGYPDNERHSEAG